MNNNDNYEFTWNGKRDALRLAQTPSTGTLRPDKESSKNWNDTENLYIEGDNLEVLKLLQKSYFGKVKMIYIDPPYNTGKDFIYKDDFKDNITNYKEITKQTTKAYPETNSRYHTNWLNMMYPRLKLAKNLLTDDGVVFISIDDYEIHNLRKICDEIFGSHNLVSQFVWRRTDNQSNIGNIAKVKEYILCYAKDKSSDDFKLNKMSLSEKAKKEYSYEDSIGKFRRKNILDKSRGKKFYDIKSPNGEVLNGPWIIDKEEFEELDINGKIYWASGKMPYGKKYLKEAEGQIISDWLDREYGTNQRASDEINELFNMRAFDFSKPVSLIKTLIQISTDYNDIILDFFSGSSTTAHAAMESNVTDCKNCKYIMIQIPEEIDENSDSYKAGYKNICEIGKERIRRAGDKIVEENKDKEGIENLDIGFKVFKLDWRNKAMDNLFTKKEYKPIELIILSNKKPKELKGKSKIASVNCRGNTYQVFVDDNYNLYYKDNSLLIDTKSCIKHDDIYGDKVEITNYYAKVWFKITGLYERRNEFILDIVRDLSEVSEELYIENTVADNVALEDLYGKLIKEYLNYLEVM